MSWCRDDLAEIGRAIGKYREAHDGQFPAGLPTLPVTDLPRLSSDSCYESHAVSAGRGAAQRVVNRCKAYVYRPPGAGAPDSRTPILWDKHPHKVPRFLWFKSRYRNVLFHDGRAETLSEGQFRKEVGNTVETDLGTVGSADGRG